MRLISDLDETRWTGRPGYPIRVMVGAALVKAIYALPTWTRTARLITEHAALREAIGGARVALGLLPVRRQAPRARRPAGRLHRPGAGRLRAARPEMGQVVAIDGSDLPAYANGHKHVGNKNGPLRTRWADPDAGWGHRSSISTRKGGAFYGYKLHAAICTATELPVAWAVRAANEPEPAQVPGLLDDAAAARLRPRRGRDGQGLRRPADAR